MDPVICVCFFKYSWKIKIGKKNVARAGFGLYILYTLEVMRRLFLTIESSKQRGKNKERSIFEY